MQGVQYRGCSTGGAVQGVQYRGIGSSVKEGGRILSLTFKPRVWEEFKGANAVPIIQSRIFDD